MATPKTGRPRGRPHQDFFDDPKRYPRALADAFIGLGLSERVSIDLANGAFRGKQTEASKKPRRRRLASADLVLIGYELPKTLSFKGANATLRSFGLRFGNMPDPPDTNQITPFRWRLYMAIAFGIALNPDPSAGFAKLESCIIAHAEVVGEREFALRVIVPMLRQKFSSPDFFTRVRI